VKNRQNKILLFPKPPEQPQASTITVQIGNERFAVHYEIEDLPPAGLPTRIGFVSPSPKRNQGLDNRSQKKSHADGD
jgi:hypothetical protein